MRDSVFIATDRYKNMKKDPSDLAPTTYFNEVRDHMVRLGFTLLSVVPIDNLECDYHVPCIAARATSMFFHVRGKSLIVMLRFDENVDLDGNHSGYWELSFYIRFLPYAKLLEQNRHWLKTDKSYGDIPVIGSHRLIVCGFVYTTGLGLNRDTENEQVGVCFVQNSTPKPMGAQVLATRIHATYRTVKKHLDSNPFRDLSIRSFVPTYTFGGDQRYPSDQRKLKELFWSKFDWQYVQRTGLLVQSSNYHRDKYAQVTPPGNVLVSS